MRIRLVIVGALMTATLPCFAAGVLSYSLTPPGIVARPGDTVYLSGTLTNTGDADLYLNDSLVQFGPPGASYLSADPNYFFANVPGILSPGDVYTGNIFQLFVAGNAPDGTFSGSGTIYGGADAFAEAPLGIQPFTVNVVPEPDAAGLFVIGATAVWTRRRWRKRSSPLRC